MLDSTITKYTVDFSRVLLTGTRFLQNWPYSSSPCLSSYKTAVIVNFSEDFYTTPRNCVQWQILQIDGSISIFDGFCRVVQGLHPALLPRSVWDLKTSHKILEVGNGLKLPLFLKRPELKGEYKGGKGLTKMLIKKRKICRKRQLPTENPTNKGDISNSSRYCFNFLTSFNRFMFLRN